MGSENNQSSSEEAWPEEIVQTAPNTISMEDGQGVTVSLMDSVQGGQHQQLLNEQTKTEK